MRILTLTLALLGLALNGCSFELPIPSASDDDSACDDDTAADDDTAGDDDTAADDDTAGDDDSAEPELVEYSITITVTADSAEFLDFSKGYCSNVEDPADCETWTQSIVQSVVGPTVSWTGTVEETGAMRFNSTYTNIDGVPTGWLCEGYENPVLTGVINVSVEGVSMGDGNSHGVPFASGCSAGINVTTLIADYLVATGG